MSETLGDAYIGIHGDVSDLPKELKRKVGDAGDAAAKEGGRRFGGSLRSALLPVAAGLATVFSLRKGVGFLKDSVAQARDAAKVAALTAQVIKSTGGAAKVTADQVAELADSISRKTGIDDDAIQSASNLLLTFTNVRNEVGKGNDIFNQATQAATDMAATLGGDASSQAIALGKALNDPVRGVTALSRVGVSFTESQKKQIKALVEHNDTLGAQKIILGELAKEFGGSAAAQATAGAKLKVSYNNLKESIGKSLLPVLDKLANFANDKVIPALYDLGGSLRKHVLPILKTVGEFIGGAVTDGFHLLGDGIGKVQKVLAPFFAGLEGKGKLAGFSGLLNTIGLGIRAMIGAFKDPDVTSGGLVGKFEKIGVALRGMYDKIMDVVGYVRANFLPALAKLGDFIGTKVLPVLGRIEEFILTKVYPALFKIAQFIITKVVPAVVKIAKFIGENLRPAFNALVKAVGPLVAKFQGLVRKIQENRGAFEKIGKVLGTVAAAIGFVVVKVVGFLLPILIKLGAFIAGVLIDIITGLVGAIGWIVGAIEKVWPVVQKIWDVFKTVFDSVWKIVSGFVEFVIGIFTGDFGKVKDGASKVLGGLLQLFRDLPGKIVDALAALAGLLYGVGKSAIDALAQAIDDAEDWVMSKIDSLINKITDKLNPFGGGVHLFGGGGGGDKKDQPPPPPDPGPQYLPSPGTGDNSDVPTKGGAGLRAAPPVTNVYLDSEKVAAVTSTKTGARAVVLARAAS